MAGEQKICSFSFCQEFIKHGAKVSAFGPEAMKSFEKMFGKNANLTYNKNEYEVAKKADVLVILTEWMQFREPDFAKLKKEMRLPVIFDGRNLYDLEDVKKSGFKYNSIGS